MNDFFNLDIADKLFLSNIVLSATFCIVVHNFAPRNGVLLKLCHYWWILFVASIPVYLLVSIIF